MNVAWFFYNTNRHFYALYLMKIDMILSVVFASPHIVMVQCIGFLLVVMRNPLGVRNFHSDHAMWNRECCAWLVDWYNAMIRSRFRVVKETRVHFWSSTITISGVNSSCFPCRIFPNWKLYLTTCWYTHTVENKACGFSKVRRMYILY